MLSLFGYWFHLSLFSCLGTFLYIRGHIIYKCGCSSSYLVFVVFTFILLSFVYFYISLTFIPALENFILCIVKAHILILIFFPIYCSHLLTWYDSKSYYILISFLVFCSGILTREYFSRVLNSSIIVPNAHNGLYLYL